MAQVMSPSPRAVPHVEQSHAEVTPNPGVEQNPMFITEDDEHKPQPQKNRSYFDPQPNAKRVEWDGGFSQDNDGAGRASGQASAQKPTMSKSQSLIRKKRERAEEHAEEQAEEIPSEDEGFQQDTRTPSVPQRQSYPTSRRTAAPVELPTRTFRRPEEPSGSPKRQRRNPGQAIDADLLAQGSDDEPPDATPAATIAEASRIAKTHKRMNKETVTQVRKPWSTAEDNRLMDLIKDHGPYYSELCRVDKNSQNVLRNRSAEDLRFRCRNLKVNFLV